MRSKSPQKLVSSVKGRCSDSVPSSPFTVIWQGHAYNAAVAVQPQKIIKGRRIYSTLFVAMILLFVSVSACPLSSYADFTAIIPQTFFRPFPGLRSFSSVRFERVLSIILNLILLLATTASFPYPLHNRSQITTTHTEIIDKNHFGRVI